MSQARWHRGELGKNRLDEARQFFERALEYREREYPDELAPERLMGLGNLADVLLRQGDTARARPLLEQCARKLEKVYGENHLIVANGLESLAALNLREGRLGDARAQVERALAIYEHNGLRRSPAVVILLVTVAKIEEAEGHLPVAEAILREAIEVVTGTLGYDSAALLNPVDALAQVLRRTGRIVEANSMELRAAEVRKKTGQAASLPIGANTPTSRIESKDEKR